MGRTESKDYSTGIFQLSANLRRFGFERVAKIETLQEIIAEMSESGNNPATARSE